MKRSIFDVSYIFALKPLFFEKNEIKWNQIDRHTMGGVFINYEYDDENTRKFIFKVKTNKKCF